MPPRISPLTDACHHVGLKTDKTWKLEVKYINAVKGRGVFAIGSFSKGDFIVEYRGDLISDGEAQKRRRIYHPACSGFLFAFKLRGKTWCIDASREDGSFGRLVNDDHRHPNCRMKRIDIAGSTHLCLFALKDIKEGEEIAYNYGGEDYPWRKQMTTCEPDTPCVSSQSVLMSEPQWDEAAWLEDTGQQMTTCEPDTPCVSSQSVLMSEPKWDEAAWLGDTGHQKRKLLEARRGIKSQQNRRKLPPAEDGAFSTVCAVSHVLPKERLHSKGNHGSQQR
ncbi:unnamed protein product [Boreogadus saida]